MYKKTLSFLILFSILVNSFTIKAQDDEWLDDITDLVGLDSVLGLRINVVDINNDMYPDIAIIKSLIVHEGTKGKARIFLNEQDPTSSNEQDRVFVEFTEASKINTAVGDPTELRRIDEMTFADIDNDGDNDVITGIWHYTESNVSHLSDRCEVMLNDGAGHFTHVADDGLEGLGLISASGFSFLDYNADGFLDVYVATYFQDYRTSRFEQDFLLQGNGDGTFTDVSFTAGIGFIEFPMQGASVTDWNNDGHPDILTSPYCRSDGSLWKNNGNGTFTDVAASVGYNARTMTGDVDQSGPRTLCQWGAIPHDFDNDGDIDILHVSVHGGIDPGEGRSVIAVNKGEAEDYELEWDLDRLIRNNPQSFHLGNTDGLWIDIDNDMLSDVVMAEAEYINSTDRLYIYHHQADHILEDITLDLRLLGIKSPHSMESFDFDRDGDNDILTSSNRTAGSFNRDENCQLVVLENAIGNENNWVTIKLEGNQNMNRNAIGAKIKVTAGGVTQTKEVQAGYSHFGGQSPFYINFGLGNNPSIEKVEVIWPSNIASPTVINNLHTNQFMTISPDGFVGRDEINLSQENKLFYPNPAIDNIRIQEQYQDYLIEVYSLLGDLVYTAPKNQQNISIGKIAAGVYMIQFIKGNDVLVERLVIQ